MKRVFTFSVFMLGLLLVQACGETKKNAETADDAEQMEASEAYGDEAEAESQEPNIVEVASGNSDFSTLVAAVKAAELVETLSSEGPFTVFAPVNAAFEKLPEGTLDNLLKPENKETLTSILTYHVVSGKVMAADVVKAIEDNGGTYEIATVGGGTLTASLDGENVILTDTEGGTSTIAATDVAASNGVIHAIDTVVMP